jgi:hypothetical protein
MRAIYLVMFSAVHQRTFVACVYTQLGSFQDGLAFAALVHRFDESLFDFSQLAPQNPTANLQLAFQCMLARTSTLYEIASN